jgi:hypothetical protein
VSFASGVRKTLDHARGIAGKLGLHPFTVSMVAITWSGGRPGVGTKTTATATITVGKGQAPKVQQISDKEVALSGNAYTNQDLRIGPLTPPFVVGGVAYGSLNPASAPPGTQFYFKITGPGFPSVGRWYERLSDETDSALHIYVVVRNTGISNP